MEASCSPAWQPISLFLFYLVVQIWMVQIWMHWEHNETSPFHPLLQPWHPNYYSKMFVPSSLGSALSGPLCTYTETIMSRILSELHYATYPQSPASSSLCATAERNAGFINIHKVTSVLESTGKFGMAHWVANASKSFNGGNVLSPNCRD